MSAFAIDTFKTYPEDISILLDANLGTLGVFIATYYNQFDEGRWKAILAFIRERTIKLIRERLDCIEELRIFIREVIESAVVDIIESQHPNVAASLHEIVELLLANVETPDALAIIKRYHPLSWDLLKELYQIGKDAWHLFSTLEKSDRYADKDTLQKCLSELERIGLVSIAHISEDDIVYHCSGCSRIMMSETLPYCFNCAINMNSVRGARFITLNECALLSLTPSGFLLMLQSRQGSFYC